MKTAIPKFAPPLKLPAFGNIEPDHHWAMDRLLIAHCPDSKHGAGVWRVGSALDSRIEGQKDLAALANQPVIPPSEEKFYPAIESLRWRENHLNAKY